MAARKQAGKNAPEPVKAEDPKPAVKAVKKIPTKAAAPIKKPRVVKPKPNREMVALDNSLKALELRKQGKTYAEIAKRLHYCDGSAAYKAVQRAMKEVLQEPVKELKELELARLDQLQNALWPRASKGSGKAIEVLLKVMARRAKLMGLDQDNIKLDAEGLVQLIWDAPAILPKETPTTKDALKPK